MNASSPTPSQPAPAPAAWAAGGRVVSVQAPGRLHMGFLDPAATLRRRFGSLGLVIDGMATRVHVRAADDSLNAVRVDTPDDADTAEDARRVAAHLKALQQQTGRLEPLELTLGDRLPVHAGLGSGTQLALAVGRAFAVWHGLDLSTAGLARLLGRGLRSGIGIASFDHGGLLLDGGRRDEGQAAPLIAHLHPPREWRVLLVIDPARRGLSGTAERQALARLEPLSRAQAAALCHHTVMQVLAGAADGDFADCAAGISAIQHTMGRYFAAAQNGSVYTSPDVERLLAWIADRLGPEGAGIGQSSWGPTGFALLPSRAAADDLLACARTAGVVAPGLHLPIVALRSTGATVFDTHAAATLGQGPR